MPIGRTAKRDRTVRWVFLVFGWKSLIIGAAVYDPRSSSEITGSGVLLSLAEIVDARRQHLHEPTIQIGLHQRFVTIELKSIVKFIYQRVPA